MSTRALWCRVWDRCCPSCCAGQARCIRRWQMRGAPVWEANRRQEWLEEGKWIKVGWVRRGKAERG